jgi:hypothetical protein
MSVLPKSDKPCRCGCGLTPKRGSTWMPGHNMPSIAQRHLTDGPVLKLEDILSRTVPDGDCLIWRGNKNFDKNGYARVRLNRVQYQVHRLAYTLAKGPIPDDLQIDHRCHDGRTCQGGKTCPHRACCNPDHLEPVTPRENSARSTPALKTHCIRGHEFTPENTWRDGRRRICRSCRRLRYRALVAPTGHEGETG